MKLQLTFATVLREARKLKRQSFTKWERRRCLYYWIRGAESWEIPNNTKGGK